MSFLFRSYGGITIALQWDKGFQRIVQQFPTLKCEGIVSGGSGCATLTEWPTSPLLSAKASCMCGKMSDYLRALCSMAKSRYLEKLSALGLEEKDDPYMVSNLT